MHGVKFYLLIDLCSVNNYACRFIQADLVYALLSVKQLLIQALFDERFLRHVLNLVVKSSMLLSDFLRYLQ